MILTQISYLDCVAFLIFLIPQLLLNVNIIKLIICGLRMIPFFLIKLPSSFIIERYFTHQLHRSPFVQRATPFQDFVIRCVRYAFANLPAKIGRVFFSKNVALPFFTFRLFRHGYAHSPIPWREIKVGGVRGLLIGHYEEDDLPEVVVYYLHGGGFSMGSAYFYLEPLLALLTLMQPHWRNPVIFALDYDLVPDKCYPVQLSQAKAGYEYVLSTLVNGEAESVVVAGDSAGATLILSLLLYLAAEPNNEDRKPGFATLISPWVSLVSENNRDTASDFLSAASLHLYGSQYARKKQYLSDPLVSPGSCRYLDWWQRAAPCHGFYITFGGEEVLGPETRELISRLKKAKVRVMVNEEPGLIHAWAIARLFLEESSEERTKGMRQLAAAITGAHFIESPTDSAENGSMEGELPKLYTKEEMEAYVTEVAKSITASSVT
ncbi:hypothetical protein MMC18_002263 [Xylographa bjoerkii]|nr:hypothetical protein [Xylographa bjoerkii]